MTFNTEYYPGWGYASVLHNRVCAPTIFIVLLKYLTLAQVLPETKNQTICIDPTQSSIHSWPRTDHELSKYFAKTITKRQIFQIFPTTTTLSTDKHPGLAQAATARLERSPLTMWGASKKILKPWTCNIRWVTSLQSQSATRQSGKSSRDSSDASSRCPSAMRPSTTAMTLRWRKARMFRSISDNGHLHCF